MAELTEAQVKVLKYLAGGGWLNFYDASYGWDRAKLDTYVDAREIDQLEDAGLIAFKRGFSTSMAEITPAGRAALQESNNDA